MSLNNLEINNVISLKPLERYKYFIKKVADFEELWVLLDSKGNHALSCLEDKTFISIWSHYPYLKTCLNDEWSKFFPTKITLDDFESNVIDYMEDDYLLNIFPVNNKSGFIVTLKEFIRDLNDELDKYA